MRKLIALTGLLAALGLVVGPAASGRPEFNPACEGTKIEPVVSGTYPVPFGTAVGSITLTVRDTDDGQVFDFQTDDPSHIATSIVVKGGPAFVTYDETNPWTGTAWSGTDLHAPFNPESGKWYGLSHVCFSTAAVEEGGGGEE